METITLPVTPRELPPTNEPQMNGGGEPSLAPAPATALEHMSPDRLLDARELAKALGCCKKSVERAWRRGELPPPFRFRGKHVWMVRVILEHFRAQQAAAIKAVRR